MYVLNFQKQLIEDDKNFSFKEKNYQFTGFSNISTKSK